MQFVRASEPTAHFDPLDIFWSVNNVSSNDVDLTAGEIGTSSYYGSIDSLFILGDDTDDTDEFDDHIIGHEWGHYFEDTLSRSDSPGGSHSFNDRLDAALAFSEGWGTAIAAMGLGDPVYCDTFIPGTLGGFDLNAETPGFGSGWYNEIAVVSFLYDLWDTDVDDTDDDSVGFLPIYNAMVGPQQFADSVATIFSFTAGLRASVDDQGRALIDSQLDRENIVSGDLLDIWGSNETDDGGIAQDVLPLHVPFVVDPMPQEICVNSSVDGVNRHGNKIGEDRYLHVTVPFDDEYLVSVVTTTPTPATPDPNDRDQSDPDIYLIHGASGGIIAAGTEDVTIVGGQPVEPTFMTPMLFASDEYAVIVEDWRFDDPNTHDNYPTRICFDVLFESTP